MYPKILKRSPPVVRLARWYLNTRIAHLEKLIFSATTGRSGTMSLTSLFSAIPGCRAFHEPYPIMNGPWLRAAAYGETNHVRRYYERVKAINIRRAAIGARYYVELNHLFLKTFLEYAVEDFGERVEVIHLVRPAVEVARSIYSLQDWPGTAAGNQWWLDFKAPSNLIQLSDLLDADNEFSHPFYKALWYWYETEARVKFWRERLPSLRFHHFETRWINDCDRIFALLDDLTIEYDRDQLRSVIGTRKNTREERLKTHAKHSNEQVRDQEAAQRMNERFKDVLQSRGLGKLLPHPLTTLHSN